MAAFAAATLAPVALIALGLAMGGLWLWAGLAYMALLSALLDQLLPLVESDASEGAEFPAADSLLVLLAFLALALPPLAILGATGTTLSPAEKIALIAATGLWLGQIAHPAAHELIHRPARRHVRLGIWVYAWMLIGHHASSHRLVHHRHVATPLDPATARRGTGFWRYLPRASIGAFRAGLAAETDLRRRKAQPGPHPYALYAGIAAAALALAALIGGWSGVLLWLILAAHAQIQIHLSDYVQHYGLTRATGPDGRPEPVNARHSWNTAHWFSSALLLNAPRHSDHHAHPARPYPALRLPDDAPRLPWPLPVACTLALIPPLWRRLMKPHLARLTTPPPTAT
ncbi:alkane 1-monooxygenase [Paragemmobacter ruber]|uniref:Alkane 1-monooxygenase n=1 Tax=Paragemmobacter ruber TaxID=1985673 RepID=A0ABW9Y6Q9_9RHOB|nr:alkane 1-monooxygenase [Rhodobacter ruber]NBE08088.1 alkane 1-monooxygenase [Rhodobacter ruber]